MRCATLSSLRPSISLFLPLSLFAYLQSLATSYLIWGGKAATLFPRVTTALDWQTISGHNVVDDVDEDDDDDDKNENDEENQTRNRYVSREHL